MALKKTTATVCKHCLGPTHLCEECWYQDAQHPKMTKGQRRVFDVVVNLYEEQGYSPSMREIGENLSIRSTNAIAEHIRALITKGYLHSHENTARSYVPVLPPKKGYHLKDALLEVAEEWEAFACSFLEQEDDPAQHAAGMIVLEMARSLREQLQYHSTRSPQEFDP